MRLSLADLSASTQGVFETTAACCFARSGVTAPIADPLVGLEGRNLRDRRFILLHNLTVKLFCVLFLVKMVLNLQAAESVLEVLQSQELNPDLQKQTRK
ncbi:MAG TPA: hypothetical protein VMM84_04505 [Pyrinomonadaceae bacterium]|nr:hypothetical protein [Pyrinomonadaceae bacterium]